MKGPLLLHRADRRTLGLLGILTVGYTSVFIPVGWLVVPCSVLAVTACAAKHNHTHRGLFSRRWLNRVMDLWLAVLTGSSTAGIRVAHQVRHHGMNQSPEDFVRCSLVWRMPPGRALLCYVPRVVRESWRQTRADLSVKRRSVLRRAGVVEKSALAVCLFAALWFDWQRFLVVPLIPWLFGQWFLIAVNLPQHDGCDAASPWAHSRNMTGRVANWFFLNNGWHTAHHERPGLHWSRLPAWHREHLSGRLPASHDCPSMISFWTQWFRNRRARFPNS